MSDKITRILTAMIGLILIFSIFLPHIIKSDKPSESLSITITKVQDETSPTTEATTQKKSAEVTTSYTHKNIQRQSTNIAAVPLFLDINTASYDELQQLKGIGPVTAKAIIDFRTEHGRFNNIDELLLVSGIGDAVFFDISDKVYVVDPVWFEPEPDEPIEPPEQDIPLEDNSESEDIPDEAVDEIFPVNINTADPETLMLIPGIDEDIADEIIYIRENIGGFVNECELLLVNGLSRDQITEIKDLLCF